MGTFDDALAGARKIIDDKVAGLEQRIAELTAQLAETLRSVATLTQQLADAQARAQELAGTVTQREADLVVARRDLADSRRQTADTGAELERVKGEYAEYRRTHPDPTTPPPAKRRVLIGADYGGWQAFTKKTNPATGRFDSSQEAFDRIQRELGPLDFGRVWPNAITADFWDRIDPRFKAMKAIAPNLGSDVEGIAAGRYDDLIRKIVRATPKGMVAIFTAGHEPENDRNPITGDFVALWGRAQYRLANLVEDVAREEGRLDELFYSPLLMNASWLADRRTNGLPGNVDGAVWMQAILDAGPRKPRILVGIDVYQWGQQAKPNAIDTAAALFGPVIAWAKAHGYQIFVGEFSARSTLTDDQRAAFIDATTALIKDGDGLFFALAYYECALGAIGPHNLTGYPPAAGFPKAVAAFNRMRLALAA